MTETGQQKSHFEWLVKTYFSDPSRRLSVKKDEIIIRQGHYNNRLYLILEGEFQGYIQTETGIQKDSLRAGANNFIGVQSFFSKTFISMATMKALTDCEVAYIDRNQAVVPTDFMTSLEQQFMPIVVEDLMRRSNKMTELNQERGQALTKLIETEKMASLGQLAAGIAHELNNAIAVLARNTHWLMERYNAAIKNKMTHTIFNIGLMQGRIYSSREVRERGKMIAEKYSLSKEKAILLGQTGLDDEILKSYKNRLEEKAEEIYNLWELGATFNDMLIASEQSTHVVNSIRALGAKHTARIPGLDINESINNALALLRSKLSSVHVQLKLRKVPAIIGNMGEFVQIWVNLINNACEAMCHLVNHNHKLNISSSATSANIIVKVKDNGLGIPQKSIDAIFQPNFTTKIHGMSFGLGLGLSIVKRIVNEYKGTIDVESARTGTTFIVKIPVGGENEET
ncbi:MAG: cyclic nucleotide-binding domain-containing protein [Calditrichaceae bacterium]|nr:cyclic nucleotide-binding domain-containing protein [Calditrichaceae bacterium]HES59910.1 cyclic nucleotide-binding domain-containing protein [Caldithrix sp.]